MNCAIPDAVLGAGNLCACGCGEFVRIDARRNFVARYRPGHNGRGARKERVERACQQCGEVFSGTAKAMRGRVYCSPECRDDYRRVHSRKDRKLPCAVCGGEHVFTADQQRRGKLYCSKACAKEAWRRAVQGKPRRRLGTSIDARRAAALERDAYRCRFCDFELALHVHHIRGKRRGHALTNLITVCPNHHALAHAAALTCEEMDEAIMAPRQPRESRRLVVDYRKRRA